MKKEYRKPDFIIDLRKIEFKEANAIARNYLATKPTQEDINQKIITALWKIEQNQELLIKDRGVWDRASRVLQLALKKLESFAIENGILAEKEGKLSKKANELVKKEIETWIDLQFRE